MKGWIVRVLFLMMSLAFCTIATAQDVSPMHEVSVSTAAGVQTWEVELASDDASRSQGLMHRKHMADNAGMLFRFDDIGHVSMWMKNTFIPLDMIFLKNDGTISSIAENTKPQSLAIVSSSEPVRYVLEINAGQAAGLNLRAGQVMRHPWFQTPSR